MKPKAGKIVSAVPPAAPSKVFEADVADPGKAAETKAKEIASGTGKYGKKEAKPFKPVSEKAASEQEAPAAAVTWIEFVLEDEAGEPVAGQKYEIEMPDGSVAKGTTDANGKTKIDGVESGKCKLSLPDLHKDSW